MSREEREQRKAAKAQAEHTKALKANTKALKAKRRADRPKPQFIGEEQDDGRDPG